MATWPGIQVIPLTFVPNTMRSVVGGRQVISNDASAVPPAATVTATGFRGVVQLTWRSPSAALWLPAAMLLNVTVPFSSIVRGARPSTTTV
jgi:hypothetical protein